MENIVGRFVRWAWGKLLNRISKKKGRTRPGALENTLASICWVDPSHPKGIKWLATFPFPGARFCPVQFWLFSRPVLGMGLSSSVRPAGTANLCRRKQRMFKTDSWVTRRDPVDAGWVLGAEVRELVSGSERQL